MISTSSQIMIFILILKIKINIIIILILDTNFINTNPFVNISPNCPRSNVYGSFNNHSTS